MKIQLSDHFTLSKLLRFVFPSIIMMIFTSIYSVVDQCGQLKPRTLIFQYFWAYILHFFTKIS